MTAIVTFNRVSGDHLRDLETAAFPACDARNGSGWTSECAILVAAEKNDDGSVTVPFLAQTQDQIEALDAIQIDSTTTQVPDNLIDRCAMRLDFPGLLNLHRDWVKAAGVTGLAFMRELQHRAGTEPCIEMSVAVSNAAGYG